MGNMFNIRWTMCILSGYLVGSICIVGEQTKYSKRLTRAWRSNKAIALRRRWCLCPRHKNLILDRSSTYVSAEGHVPPTKHVPGYITMNRDRWSKPLAYTSAYNRARPTMCDDSIVARYCVISEGDAQSVAKRRRSHSVPGELLVLSTSMEAISKKNKH